MSQPWLEDLSEEWVAQPSPPPAAIDAQQSSPAPAPQSAPTKLQSRLPRMRTSSGTFSEIRVRHIASDLRLPKRRSALVERSLSDNGTPSADASYIASLYGAPDSSAASLDSIAYDGTVAQKPVAKSSSKDTSTEDAPEWRRRLLQGDGGQKDLFSPMGLENIFQKPDGPASAEQQPKRRGNMFKGFSAMPSSPPPWPAQEEESVQEDSVIQHTESPQEETSEAPGKTHSDSMEGSSVLKGTEVSAGLLQVPQGQARTVSGQIEYENESFSPVYLTTNLSVGAQPSPIPNFRGSELANRLRHIGTPPEQEHSVVPEEDSANQCHAESSFARIQDDSLPEDLPAGTPSMADVTDMGRFVDMKRGGYSRDGSFRTRALSPSPRRPQKPSALRTETLPAVSVNSSTTPEDTDDELAIGDPKTPRVVIQPGSLSPERTRGSGSPLKLFDAHDTFTSNRLHRRLSQLEHRSDRTDKSASSSVQMNKTEVTKIFQKELRLTSVEEVSIQKDDTSPAHQQPRRVSTFGEGDLNEHPFSGDFSIVSSHDGEDSAPDESPSMNVAPPGSRPPLKFNYDASPTSREVSRAQRPARARVTSHYRVLSRAIPQIVRQASSTAEEEVLVPPNEYADGKRGPTSPFKNPTPKRRRTIQKDDDAFLVGLDVQSTHDPEVATGTSSGRNTKDSRHEAASNVANPEVLARRHILRPRNPTPSQKRLEELYGDILEATEAFIHSSPKMNTIREHIEPADEEDSIADEDRAAIVANEVAAFSLERQQGMRDNSRKRSVTTQDFLAEAVKIMDFIRAKGKPAGGLASLEESESENHADFEKNDYPSSSFTFDRPPSREGRASTWKDPNKPELDSQKMSHLRKYQENESDEFADSSFRSCGMSHMGGTPSPQERDIVVEQDGIRIIDNPNRNLEPTADGAQDHSPPMANGTLRSMQSSMGNTVATSTSRKSDHVNKLAPEAVAHLIPQEVAGMSFNPEQNIWVRQKSPSRQHHPEEHSGTNESEEDPLGNISDLSVDETAERMRDNPSPTRPQATAETVLEDSEEAPHVYDDKTRPVTRDGQGTVTTNSSSVPSKASNFAWSFPKPETRATSWSDQETVKGGTQKLQQLPPMTYTIPESDEDDIEHEIKYFEGRENARSAMRDGRIRDITISIAEREFNDTHRHEGETDSPQKQASSRWSAMDHRKHSSLQKSLWHGKGAHTFTHAGTVRNPDVDEKDVSVFDGRQSNNYRMELSMNVSAPALRNAEVLMPAASSPAKGDATFMLSDLPDFTLNQVDECELPDRVVVRHDGYKYSKALEDRYALGTAELVKALQDVEPNEPYWEDLREVDLHNKGLDNLHRLDEFCYRLEELNVSDNSINQTRGIPCTMRRLWAQNNCLTGLTSWAHLSNLQHLDISGNDIDSLDGLGELVHLRTLKVDDNKIQSLHGIRYLDGLMELSAARNEIEIVDFARANLKSLTDVVLRGNRLVEVRNVHCLPQLQHLDLDQNCIEEFPIFDETTDRCKALRSLRVCGNGMVTLDVNDYFPRLESLYADRNALTNVVGLERLRHLRTFSARDQEVQTDAESCVDNFVKNPDVRNLYLSLNVTRGIGLSQHLLNLQRLELSSMGLKELPDNFGQLTPNIRSINLNFNSIKDLRPLLNIKRLDELLLAGNKLARLRTNAMVLGKLSTLTKLDWRDNPLTIRFYALASENRIMSLRKKPSDEQSMDQFVLPQGNVDEDQQYLSRLDYETRIRRRVTEMMLANFCRNLRQLDGLPFDKARVLVKDDIWERLLYLGVIQRKQPDAIDEATE